VRAAAYGSTVGASVGLAMVECADGVTDEWLASGRFQVVTPHGAYPLTPSSSPFYDPKRLRILARDDHGS
jgi:sarcosine dehydrogenase